MRTHDFPFTAREICDLEGVRIPNNGKSKVRMTCPVCGHSMALEIDLDDDLFKCHACDESGGLLHFYLFLEDKNIPLSEAREEIMEKLHLNNTSLSQEERIKVKKEREAKLKAREASRIPQSNLRNIQDRNKTYSFLLNLLTLAEDHKKNLIERGLSLETIKKRKYRTVPLSFFENYAFKILEEGLYVDGIPGFYRGDNGKWRLRQVKRGILIPIINHHGDIEGFQIRKDNRLLRTSYKKIKGEFVLDSNGKKIETMENKFVWLSSNNLPDGTSGGGFIHYACDYVSKDGLMVPKLSKDKGILLTEGPLKGDIFFEKTSYPALCVPGVSCQNKLADELDFLKAQGFTTIYNGYDMDYLSNKNVYKQLIKSYKLILSKGFELKRLVWNTEHKGIDDYYCFKARRK